MKTVILPIPIHRIFEDAAKTFAAVPCDDTLCFGVQDWTREQVQEQRDLAQGKLIAFQSELLCEGNMPFRNEEYVDKLRLFDEIWDYSEHNLPFLYQNGFVNAKYVPLLPNDLLKSPPRTKDIDILHFGAHTRHRVDLINRILQEGFDMVDVLTDYQTSIHGESMHDLILRSKVVLGTHNCPRCPIQESFRYQFPLSNGIDVLGERSLTNVLQIDEFGTADEMIEKLHQRVQSRQPNPSVLERKLQVCVFYQDYLREACVNLDGRNLRNAVYYAIEAMKKDMEVLVRIAGCAERQAEVESSYYKIFSSVLQILALKEKNKTAFPRTEWESIEKKLLDIYKNIHLKDIRVGIASTGGRFMPALRKLLFLNGWNVTKASIRMAVVLHSEEKLLHEKLVVFTD